MINSTHLGYRVCHITQLGTVFRGRLTMVDEKANLAGIQGHRPGSSGYKEVNLDEVQFA